MALDRLRGPGADGTRPCRVAGLNQNYTSRSGTAYHIQVEDRGPVKDRLTGHHVRRLNVIVYANYAHKREHCAQLKLFRQRLSA